MWKLSRRHALRAAAFIVAKHDTMASADSAALRRRYQSLKAQYESLKQTGADLSALTAVISQIQQAVRAEDMSSLNALLDQFEARLQQIQPGSHMSAATSAPLPLPAPSSPAPEGGVEGDIIAAMRSDPTFLKLLRARAPKVAPDGAVGRNINHYADAAAQRDTIWLALRGLATGNAEDIDGTVRSLEYAFIHQMPAGNFANTHGLSALRAVEGDAFFLQAFGRIYFLIADSSFRSMALPRLDDLKPRLALAMQWLAVNTAELQRQDQLATNRLFFDAVAFYLNGKILGDASLRTVGMTFARAGLSNQRPDGTFNEHDGTDSSYQAVSILNITGLIAHTDNPEFRARLMDALRRGTAWEKTRILPDGQVAVAGNSRTGLGQEQFMGRPKDVNYPEVALALLYASVLLGDGSLRALGDSVVNYFDAHIHAL